MLLLTFVQIIDIPIKYHFLIKYCRKMEIELLDYKADMININVSHSSFFCIDIFFVGWNYLRKSPFLSQIRGSTLRSNYAEW